MPEKTRRITRGDIPKIARLYRGRKSIAELDWLFSDPTSEGVYNGLVAENGDLEIVGVIGFAISIYRQDGCTAKGVIPFSWKIAEGYKGFAGVQLMKKILSKGDFAITISGSGQALSLYRMFHLQYHSDVHTYFCLLDPLAFFLFQKKSLPRKAALTALLLPSCLAQFRHTSYENLISLEPYDGSNFTPDHTDGHKLSKVVDKKQLDWMLRCPCVDAYAFNIYRKGQPLGFCVFYIATAGRSRRGRIVHLPPITGDGDLWRAFLRKAIRFFKSNHCCSFTIIEHADPKESRCRDFGFSSIKRHNKPVFVLDNNGVKEQLDFDSWTIQYDEGDKAYRTI